MLSSLINRLLGHAGIQIIRIPKSGAPQPQTSLTGFKERIAADPLNAALHLEFATAARDSGRLHLAYAELKSAEFLGIDSARTADSKAACLAAMPDPADMNHNQYYRFLTLSTEVLKQSESPECSVLDVGGGQGELASFLPDADYCLAEPGVNGISGTELPFENESFDYVVSCHVLEHIPVPFRTRFLDQLMSKSRRGVILQNPFEVKGTHVDERLQLIIDVTKEDWAKEHVDCSLPKVDDLQQYAAERQLEISVTPCATLTTSLALVFLDYFAAHARMLDDWKKINRFFNQQLSGIMDSPQHPTAYTVVLRKS